MVLRLDNPSKHIFRFTNIAVSFSILVLQTEDYSQLTYGWLERCALNIAVLHTLAKVITFNRMKFFRYRNKTIVKSR